MSVLLANGNTVVIEEELQEQAAQLVKDQHDRVITGVQLRNDDGSEVTLPSNLAQLVRQILEGLSRGPLTVTTLPHELTTTTAAEMLAVSRPTLMKWIAAGDLDAHKVGSHTRLLTSDVLAFRHVIRARRAAAFEELRAFDAELASAEE